jgi:hypothetical protein
MRGFTRFRYFHLKFSSEFLGSLLLLHASLLWLTSLLLQTSLLPLASVVPAFDPATFGVCCSCSCFRPCCCQCSWCGWHLVPAVACIPAAAGVPAVSCDSNVARVPLDAGVLSVACFLLALLNNQKFLLDF